MPFEERLFKCDLMADKYSSVPIDKSMISLLRQSSQIQELLFRNLTTAYEVGGVNEIADIVILVLVIGQRFRRRLSAFSIRVSSTTALSFSQLSRPRIVRHLGPNAKYFFVCARRRLTSCPLCVTDFVFRNPGVSILRKRPTQYKY